LTIAFAFLVLVFAGVACGRGGDDNRAPAEGAQVEDLASLLEPIRSKYDLPALAGSIVFEGRTVAIGATGFRVRSGEDRVSADDRWHLGSCAKAMTATLAALLVEEGRLSWETTLGEVFPEETAGQPAWRPVTIEQLLRHQSGLPEDRHRPEAPWNEPLSGSLPEQRRYIVRATLAEAPESAPGTATNYANAGYMIVGSILEVLTGDSWEDLMRARLFDPLKMASAGFGPPRPPPQPQGHWGRVPLGIGPEADNPPALGPAGTVHASLEDWGKFVSLHLIGSKRRSELIERESVIRMHTPAEGTLYAMGWGTHERGWGGQVIAHSGSNGYWYSVVWASPEQAFAVLVATNEGGDQAAKGTDEAAAALIRHFKAGRVQ
jgi:CubicO group peptidase (beta-lactamase class C family)